MFKGIPGFENGVISHPPSSRYLYVIPPLPGVLYWYSIMVRSHISGTMYITWSPQWMDHGVKKREAMNKSQQFCRARLSGRVSVFLVLWTIGMGPVLTFSAFEKRAYQHWNQHVMQAGWFHPLPGTAQGFQNQQHTHKTRQDTSTKSYTPTWDISGWFMIAPVHNAVVCCVIVNFTIYVHWSLPPFIVNILQSTMV